MQDYNLTRLTKYSMDVQIEFKHPKALAQSASDPDSLRIKFKNTNIFIDRSDGVSMDQNMKIHIPLVP